jgi:type I restriction enzyme S subunit
MRTIQSDLQAFEHTGTIFGAINKNQFEALKLPKPNPLLVSAFEDMVFGLDEQIKMNLLQARTLAATRDLLLPKLMSGEIRVRDAEKLVEDVA